MTENLTKSFISHRNVGLAPDGIFELAFNHAEGGFEIRPLDSAAKSPLMVHNPRFSVAWTHLQLADRTMYR